MTAMKDMQEKLTQESKESEACMMPKKKKITKLTRKMKKWPAWFITKDSESNEEVKASIHSEASDEAVRSKKGISSKAIGLHALWPSSKFKTWLWTQPKHN